MMHSMDNRPCSACGDLDGCHLPAKIRHKRLTMDEFWEAQADWSQKTFGLDTDRGPAGPLKHLAKEVQEALANPTDVFEYADLQFLVFDAARRAGFSFKTLLSACNAKLIVNMGREWPKPSNNDEPVEHVRDDDEPTDPDTELYEENGGEA